MATTENRLSRVAGADGKRQIIVKVTISRNCRPCFKTGIYIDKKYFKPIKETKSGNVYGIVPPKRSQLNFLEIKESTDAKNKLDGFINRILKICQVTEEKDKSLLSKSWIEQSLLATKNMSADDITYSILYEFAENPSINGNNKTFFELFDYYLENVKFSNVRERNFRVLERALRRYELFIQETKHKNFKIEVDYINKDFIEDFESYLRNEYTLFEEMPTIFKNFSVNTGIGRLHRPSQRGNNTICALFNKFKAFYHWCNDQGITKNNPFLGCKIKPEKYGTPYYLTIEERNQIADFDFSGQEYLGIQRDIFIFQCCIGCRVSDLIKMTGESVINEAIEYIPHKTKNDRPTVVRVPLNSRAKMLVNKYMKGKKDNLFPFISAQSYNRDIKKIFKFCGITRMVTVLNSVTGEEEKVPINEVASSHMARRTFIGNLYKKIKDPNLICPLSGHTNGSKAFARYREIDEDMKKEIVSLLD